VSRLHRSVDQYLALRRAMGYKLEGEARLLAQFVDFADAAGISTITTEVALKWATLPPEGSTGWFARRLRVVRGLARHLQASDPATQVPPADLLPNRTSHRHKPYLYSDADILSLLAAARTLASPLRAATFETLIGLLSVTGLRISEAMALNRADIDWANGQLAINDTKFGKSRLVPVHPSTIDALRSYAQRRDRLGVHPSDSFFVSTRGARLRHSTIYPAFHQLLAQTGLEHDYSPCPRLHDFRHSFAVKTLLGWYREGVDVAAHMPLLSTYLGHVNPASTYWYLSAAPELLALAAKYLEDTELENDEGAQS